MFGPVSVAVSRLSSERGHRAHVTVWWGGQRFQPTLGGQTTERATAINYRATDTDDETVARATATASSTGQRDARTETTAAETSQTESPRTGHGFSRESATVPGGSVIRDWSRSIRSRSLSAPRRPCRCS